MSARGAQAHLSADLAAQVGTMIAAKASTRQIAAATGCHVKTIQARRRAFMSQVLHTISVNDLHSARVAQLCVVGGCIDEANGATKYCRLHSHTPGRRAVGASAPMSRLMAGR